MRKMPYRLLILLLILLTAISACGLNPKGSGGGPLSNLGFAGTAECLLSGCHDSLEAASGSYAGFTPDTTWALGSHGNINAVPDSVTGTATGCDSCHDPAGDITDAAYLFTTTVASNGISGTVLSAIGLTVRPMVGCEGCHGTGTEHYAYLDTTTFGFSVGDHGIPFDSTVSPVFDHLFHASSCGPCHSPDEHAGAATTNILANQYPEWFGGDGPGIILQDGHADSFIVETANQGDMVDSVRGTACAACHTPEGFVRIFAWSESLPQSTIDRIVAETGNADLTDPDGQPGSSAFGQVTCTSCHSSHEPGNKVRYPFSKADICIQCHNVRALQAADGSGITGTGTLEIPRHPQKEIFEGVQNANNDSLRGVESLSSFLPSYTTADSSHASTATINIPDGCAGCHYTVVNDTDLDQFPQKATTGHEFRPRLETCLIIGCHPGGSNLLIIESGNVVSFTYDPDTVEAFDFSSVLFSGTTYPAFFSDNDYDGDTVVESFQDEITGMLSELKVKIQDAGGDFDASQGLFDLTLMASDSNTIRAAAYNYDYVVEDGSLGMHNPLYVVNLLAASISVLP